MDGSRQFDQHLPEGFWDNYIQSLSNQGVKPSVVRWYVFRVENFLKAHPETPVDQLRPGRP